MAFLAARRPREVFGTSRWQLLIGRYTNYACIRKRRVMAGFGPAAETPLAGGPAIRWTGRTYAARNGCFLTQ
jgi:hypothetical protein